jgi:hypothetical protein
MCKGRGSLANVPKEQKKQPAPKPEGVPLPLPTAPCCHCCPTSPSCCRCHFPSHHHRCHPCPCRHCHHCRCLSLALSPLVSWSTSTSPSHEQGLIGRVMWCHERLSRACRQGRGSRVTITTLWADAHSSGVQRGVGLGFVTGSKQPNKRKRKYFISEK